MRSLSINGGTSVAMCAKRTERGARDVDFVRATLLREITEHGVACAHWSVVLFESDCGDDGLADDAQAAADGLRPLYDASAGNAGFASVAFAALPPDDVRALCAAARRAWQRLRRPNVLVAVPATAAGVKAVFRLTTEAINVQITGIDSHVDYSGVGAAYIAGLRHRAERGLPVAGITSFATLSADRRDLGADHDIGRFAGIRRELFLPATFGDLLRLGARPQLLLGHRLDDHPNQTS
jgi:hypothetical protein